MAACKFADYGNVAIGWQKENPDKHGFILEYYKACSINKFKASVELRYESICRRLSGFITTGYEF
ncbi:MAG: hypothetical protein PHR00_01100 [Patescibacteria group bacterium]|nr:hypothetical protein [Patescibacteria group bacterium]